MKSFFNNKKGASVILEQVFVVVFGIMILVLVVLVFTTFRDKSIDFIAEKGQKIIYIQVTYLLHSAEVIERKYGNLEKIKDNWPKWVVSLDDIALPAKNGIEHVQAWRLISLL